MARYWGKKVDGNHAAIRDDFRKAGWKWLDLHRVGGGAPDGLTLAPWGEMYLIEAKTLEGKKTQKAVTRGTTKDTQAAFHSEWPVRVISSLEQAHEMRTALTRARLLATRAVAAKPQPDTTSERLRVV